MENVWIVVTDSIFGRKSYMIVGWDNVVATYNDALVAGDRPVLYESEVNELGFLVEGKKIREYFDRMKINK